MALARRGGGRRAARRRRAGRARPRSVEARPGARAAAEAGAKRDLRPAAAPPLSRTLLVATFVHGAPRSAPIPALPHLADSRQQPERLCGEAADAGVRVVAGSAEQAHPAAVRKAV